MKNEESRVEDNLQITSPVDGHFTVFIWTRLKDVANEPGFKHRGLLTGKHATYSTVQYSTPVSTVFTAVPRMR